MKNSVIPTPVPVVMQSNKETWWAGLVRRLVHKRLAEIDKGFVILLEDGNRFSFGDADAPADLRATVEVHHPRAYIDMGLGGSVGAGKAYIEGTWSCDNLPAFFRIFIVNRNVMIDLEKGWARTTQPLLSLFQLLRRNTREGSRKNIEAHYDLGNDFFKLFLDDTLTYSCGIFDSKHTGLREASIAKYDRLCQKLDLGPEDHVLEIGTGWGGFAMHAVRNYGCRVTTTTISPQQYALAVERIREAGLEDRITLLLKDYRDLEGKYDKLVSIEMIEAVGHKYYDAYFSTCAQLLKPNGMMALQAITITDQVYEGVKDSVDFIKRYIFPGSTIPSVTAICQSLTQSSDLRLFHLEDITSHYVTTLRRWRERFLARLNEVRRLGYSDTFIRAWDFYFTYCEAGFAERWIGDVQMVLVKPEYRHASL
jgi:cyclopropane-fatty-acyl-phospholipid synthase